MAKLTSENATITFDVFAPDQETQQLLNQAVTHSLGHLLKQDRDHLKQITLSQSPQQKEPSSAPPEEKYAKNRLEAPELKSLGGKWFYSVGIVSDSNGKMVRIAKGPIKGSWYRDRQTEEMVANPDDPLHPISEVNKVNIKGAEEWTWLHSKVMQRLQAIAEGTM